MAGEDVATKKKEEPQRMTVHSSIPPVPVLGDHHVWNLNCTIAEITAQGARRMRELNYSHPSDLTVEQWHAILEEMAAGFEKFAKQYAAGEEIDFNATKRSLQLFTRWFHDPWD